MALGGFGKPKPNPSNPIDNKQSMNDTQYTIKSTMPDTNNTENNDEKFRET